MGNLSVDTWRTIYDTLKKQRGTQDAADTPLGQMFALLDGYEATLRQSEAEIAKLRAALERIVNVKPYYGYEADEMLNIARAALEGK